MSNDVTSVLAVIKENTFTVSDMHRRLGVLRQCLDTALFTESSVQLMQVCTENLLKEGSEEDAQAIIAWGETVLTSFTRENVSAKMTDIHAAVDDLPLLTLYIPREFSSEDIIGIGKWCRTQCDSSVIIDIHIDPRVVGGCAFVWNDTYHEISFRTRIKEHAGVITNTLSSYAI